jgi:lysozyme
MMDWFEDLACQVTEALCQRFEGFYSRPYLCPAGVPTIGYGATYYLDGRPVKLGDPPISREVATVMLRDMVRHRYLPAVMKLCPHCETPHQLAALIDFAFNLGVGRLKASTLRKRANARDWPGAVTEVLKWIRGGGKVLKGLVLRRQAEAILLQKG